MLIFFVTSVSAKPLSIETSNEYLEILKVKENMANTLDIFLNPLFEGVLKGLSNNLSKQGVPAEKITLGINALRPYLIDTKNEILEDIENIIPFENLQKEIYHPVFSESFSEEELSEIILFLKTPIGKKYIQESYGVLKKSSELSQQKFGPAFEKAFLDRYVPKKEEAKASIIKALESASN
tara:strand:+ start:90 stop:632 length:543 start_codon:yes stop_codon:yes gene_type:complete